jgi:hypothetical protein
MRLIVLFALGCESPPVFEYTCGPNHDLLCCTSAYDATRCDTPGATCANKSATLLCTCGEFGPYWICNYSFPVDLSFTSPD